MTLRIWTAHLSVEHPASLDITRAGVLRAQKANRKAPGECFAPSSALVFPFLDFRRNVEALAASGECDLAKVLDDAAWQAYGRLYHAEMNVSRGMPLETWGPLERLAKTRQVRPMPAAWDWWMTRERVCFKCACKTAPGKDLRCHRVLLAGLLASLGAIYEGEVTAT